MKEYRKKPLIINAIQFTPENLEEIKILFHKHPYVMYHEDINKISIQTLEGVMWASPGDYIIRGIEGELYPCKPNIFMETYEDPDVSM